MWRVEQVIEGSQGKWLGDCSGQVITGFSTDTRTICPGEVFVALQGPRFDGHDFVGQAFERGATAAMVSRSETGLREKGWGRFFNRHSFILVEDPLRGLQSMAAWHRRRFHLPVVGITGSNGKTTTKEMVAAILAMRGSVLKSEGNLNNHIGLPLSLLRLKKRDHAAVLEMGISKKGDMKPLCKIAQPTVGLITNIGPAHLEFLGDLQGVAKEKGGLFETIRRGGTAVINRDDPYLQPWEERLSEKWTYSLGRPADVTATDVEQGPTGMTLTLHLNREGKKRGRVALSTFGRHQIYNALAAATAAFALGFGFDEVREGLGIFHPIALRAEILEVKGIHVLLDAYNANPASMKAALQMLAELAPKGDKGRGRSARKVALLGDMLELGDFAASAHLETGRSAAQNGIDLLITVGEWAVKAAEGAREAGMPPEAVFAYPDLESVEAVLPVQIHKGDYLLIKGSRGMKMENVLTCLGMEKSR
jgi:UDP-N-acetylmuramoyl-tripeptide--D-alanyl-D-alanine ligase